MPNLAHIASDLCKKMGLQFREYVGCGAFKETYEVAGSDDAKYALKVFDPSKCNLSRSEREINALRKCNTESIGKLIDYGSAFAASGESFFYSLEEFLDGGTLADKLTKSLTLTPVEIRLYGISLVQAIDHLRQRQLVHRDIKPANIMFRMNQPQPVLVDFGLVRDMSESSLTLSWIPQGPGTPFFSAPEQLNNEKGLIDWRTDQFGIGLVLYYCLTGKHAYAENGVNAIGAITSVSARKAPSSEFVSTTKGNSLSWISRMVEPWSVRRFPSPDSIIAAIEKGD